VSQTSTLDARDIEQYICEMTNIPVV